MQPKPRRHAYLKLVVILILALAALPLATAVTRARRAPSAFTPSPEIVNAMPQTDEGMEPVRAKFVPGEILVRFRADAKITKGSGIVTIALTEEGRDIPVRVEQFGGSSVVEGLRLARVTPEDTLQTVKAFNARVDVLYAEPNYIWHQNSTTPNDPRFTEQWGNVDTEAFKVWDATKGSSDVVVGVIDGGVDINHEDLRDNIWKNLGEVPGNGIDDDGDGLVDDVRGWDFVHNDNTVFDDEHGDDHGTHVAGIIGARGNNGIGVAGVCWNVSILPIKALGPNGGAISDIVSAYGYAKRLRESGVNLRVLNNSYGGPARSQAAFDAISQLNQAGILFVVAAGNEHRDNYKYPEYPSNYDIPNVIAVAATVQGGGIDPSYSNYSEYKVPLAAPGTNILSTLPHNTYGYFSGTSMAAPHVSGAAALVIAAKPDVTLQVLKGALIYSKPAPGAGVKGYLSAYQTMLAVQENDTTAPAPPVGFNAQTIGFGGSGFQLGWISPGDDGMNGTISDYDLTFINSSGTRIPVHTVFSLKPAGTGQSMVNVPLPLRNASGTFELRAFDNVGNSAAASIPVSVSADDASIPYIMSLGPHAPLSTGGQRLALDGDDQYLTYTLPFNVEIGGNWPYAKLSTNGVIHLGLNSPPQRRDGTNDDIPSSVEYMTGLPVIAGLWDDLVIDQTKRTDAGVYVVQPNPDTVIFRWQATTLAGGNPVNFEIELRRDGTFVYRYGDGNENLSPIVGLSLGFPESYVVPSHTHEYWQGGPRLSLTNAQTVTFAKRVIPRSVFQFGQDNFRVSESAGSVTVTVTKPVFASGLPAIGTFSLNYATSAGTARPGSDYVETSGTLTFDGGDFRSFTVPIINDNNIEPDETINITLSNPTNGSALGSRSTALITILNDDYGGPSQTQFSNATYTASESAGNARMTVVRSGDTSGPATVLYTTSDGSAQQRADYTVNAGLLNFSPGETSKSFNVLITDDAFPEGDETVALALSNPVGTSLGAQSTATLTITDNDTSTATSNPIDDARLFVQQHYLDFLNRVPDDGGLSYWTGQITQCGTDQNCINSRRVGVSAAYFIELEFQETGSYVYRLYKASYGQRPGYAKFMPDRSRVVGGANLESGKQDFAETFVQRPEFTAKYPLKLSAGEFVDALISAVQQDSGLSLQGKRNELVVEYIVGTNQTNSRALVLRKLIEYPEFASAEYNRAFVLMQYFGYLRRDADAGGYQFWLDVLNNRVPNDASGYRSMVCAFITSAEYQQRFSPIVTRNDHICGSINP